ncbi:MAG: hypothetical protein OEZ59_04620 [Deltaproteobacteria bacterium]|nr:hypothetical protein [Deltaproteobacteria bacterium]
MNVLYKFALVLAALLSVAFLYACGGEAEKKDASSEPLLPPLVSSALGEFDIRGKYWETPCYEHPGAPGEYQLQGLKVRPDDSASFLEFNYVNMTCSNLYSPDATKGPVHHGNAQKVGLTGTVDVGWAGGGDPLGLGATVTASIIKFVFPDGSSDQTIAFVDDRTAPAKIFFGDRSTAPEGALPTALNIMASTDQFVTEFNSTKGFFPITGTQWASACYPRDAVYVVAETTFGSVMGARVETEFSDSGCVTKTGVYAIYNVSWSKTGQVAMPRGWSDGTGAITPPPPGLADSVTASTMVLGIYVGGAWMGDIYTLGFVHDGGPAILYMGDENAGVSFDGVYPDTLHNLPSFIQ